MTLRLPASGHAVPWLTAVASARLRGFLVFTTATAAIVLHVLVDSFIAIEPGASRADIYGEKGQGSEKALTPAYYEAAGEPKTLWEIPGAAHTRAASTPSHASTSSA